MQKESNSSHHTKPSRTLLLINITTVFLAITIVLVLRNKGLFNGLTNIYAEQLNIATSNNQILVNGGTRNSLIKEVASNLLDILGPLTSFVLIFCTILLEFSRQMHWGHSDIIRAKSNYYTLYAFFIMAGLFVFEVIFDSFSNTILLLIFTILHFALLVVFSIFALLCSSEKSVERQIEEHYVSKVANINELYSRRPCAFEEDPKANEFFQGIRNIILSLSQGTGTTTLYGFQRAPKLIKSIICAIEQPMVYLYVGQEISQSLLAASSEFSWKNEYLNEIYSSAFSFDGHSESIAQTEEDQRKMNYCIGHLIGIAYSYLVNIITNKEFVHYTQQSMRYLEQHSQNLIYNIQIKLALCTLWRKLTFALPNDVYIYRISKYLKLTVDEIMYLNSNANGTDERKKEFLNLLCIVWDRLSTLDFSVSNSVLAQASWLCAIQNLLAGCEVSSSIEMYRVKFESSILANKLHVR